MPIRGLAAEVERQSTDTVVRKLVGEHEGDLATRVEFVRTQSGSDSCIAASNNKKLDYVEHMGKLAAYFRGLADGNRLRILNLLFHGELCGCDIQHVLGASQSTVSRHLTYLKNAGLILDRRVGFRVFHRLVQSADPHPTELFEYLAVAFANDKVLKSDTKKLREAIKGGSRTVSEWKPLSGLAVQKPQAEGA